METSVGGRLKQFRESKGLKQTAFAERADIKQTTFSAIEKGDSVPSYPILQKLFTAYPDLAPDWLLMGEGPMVKNGRVLTPAPAEENPAPRFTTAEETVEEASTLIKLAEAEAVNRQLLQRLEDARGEILWLRGKSTPSSYAAAPEVEPLKMRRWHEVVSELPQVGGKQLFMDTTGPVSNREAA